MIYRGEHRSGASRRARLLEGVIAPVIALTLLPVGAVATAKPRACTGQAPTAIVITQTIGVGSGVDATFTYEISRGTIFDPAAVVATVTLTLVAGETNVSTTVGGVGPGAYTVHQDPDPNGVYAPAPDAGATIDPPSCPPTVSFTNLVEPA